MVMCATWTTYRKKKTRIPWGKNCWGILRLWPSQNCRPGFSGTQDTSRLVSESDPIWEPRKSWRGFFGSLPITRLFRHGSMDSFWTSWTPDRKRFQDVSKTASKFENHRIASQNIWEQIVKFRDFPSLSNNKRGTWMTPGIATTWLASCI